MVHASTGTWAPRIKLTGNAQTVDVPRFVAAEWRLVTANGLALSRCPQSALVQLFQVLLQLHELTFAIGSPVGRTEENQHETLGTEEAAEVVALPGLIGELKIGHASTHRGTGTLGHCLAPSAGARQHHQQQPFASHVRLSQANTEARGLECAELDPVFERVA